MLHAHSLISGIERLADSDDWIYECDAEGCSVFMLNDGTQQRFRKYVWDIPLSMSRLAKYAHMPELRK